MVKPVAAAAGADGVVRPFQGQAEEADGDEGGTGTAGPMAVNTTASGWPTISARIPRSTTLQVAAFAVSAPVFGDSAVDVPEAVPPDAAVPAALCPA